MAYFDYVISQEISAKRYPFDALLMAAMTQADTDNAARLREAFPAVWTELWVRYNATSGRTADEL
jgi:hypothetical protein